MMKTKTKLKLKNNWKTKTKTKKYIKTKITLLGGMFSRRI